MSDNLYNLTLDIRERVRYLQELGVDSVGVDLPGRTSAAVVRTAPKVAETPTPPASTPPIMSTAAVPPKERRRPGSRLKDLPSLSERPLGARPRRETPTTTPAAYQSQPVMDRPSVEPPTLPMPEAIMAIRAEIGNCVRCPLHEGRTQIVHSTGSFNAKLMFVGEAPGADEDAEGKPFVGRAGKLLTDIISGMGFRRDDVFIGNINRCRPPGNRQPLPIETEACRPFLLREVEIIKPKVIVVLGNTATQNLLSIKTPISKIRGQFQDYFGTRVMPTFHPAYLLRDPHKKRDVWEDMKKVRDYINALPSQEAPG
jgi:uracil-DNA glycosylase family 4